MPTTIEILADLRQRGIVPQQTAAESHAMFRERSPEEREAEDRGQLQHRIDHLLAGRVPPRILTRVRIEDMIIVTRALGEFRLLSTDEEDEAILDLTEEQRGLLTEVRVEWWDA